jgi:hypothetical protein
MSWQDPDKILFSVSLYPKGFIHFGYGIRGGGMSVGTTPIMARLDVPSDCGTYPDGWFILDNFRSIIKIKNSFQEKDNIVPEWLLLDCYRYHYEKLICKLKLAI